MFLYLSQKAQKLYLRFCRPVEPSIGLLGAGNSIKCRKCCKISRTQVLEAWTQTIRRTKALSGSHHWEMLVQVDVQFAIQHKEGQGKLWVTQKWNWLKQINWLNSHRNLSNFRSSEALGMKSIKDARVAGNKNCYCGQSTGEGHSKLHIEISLRVNRGGSGFQRTNQEMNAEIESSGLVSMDKNKAFLDLHFQEVNWPSEYPSFCL